MWPFSSSSFIRNTFLAGLALASSDAVAQENLSVPVQLLKLPRAQDGMEGQRPTIPEAPQVTPAARMPQYQWHRGNSEAVNNLESPSVRFLLATPDRPLLVEALVTIDGQPFAQPREQRIQKLISFMNDPEVLREAKASLPTATDPEQQTAVNATPEAQRESTPKSSEVEVSPSEPQEAPKNEQPNDPAGEAVAKYQPPSTLEERMKRHMKSTGTKPSAQEIRWMLENLIDGPVLLYLNDNFQRFRAEQQPLFSVLESRPSRFCR